MSVTNAFANSACEEEPDYNNELIVSVKLDKYHIHDGIIVYNTSKVLYLPLKPLFSALNLDYSEPHEGVFESKLFSDKKSLVIDVEKKRFFLEKHDLIEEEYSEKDIKCYLGEIYISKEYFEKVLPVIVSLSIPNLTLTLKSKRLFPVHIKNKIHELESNRDVFLRFRKDNHVLDDAVKVKREKMLYSGSVKVNGASDGTYGTNLFANIKYDNNYVDSSISYRVAKQDDDNLIATYKVAKKMDYQALKLIEAGHVFMPRELGVVQGLAGVGFKVTNESENIIFDESINFSMIARPGWFSEVLINGRLVDFKKVPDDGVLIFENLQASPGINNVKVILYGDKGEIKEFNKIYYISGVYQYKKKLVYTLSGIEQKDTHQRVYGLVGRYGLTKNVLLKYGVWSHEDKLTQKLSLYKYHYLLDLKISGVKGAGDNGGAGFLYSATLKRPFGLMANIAFSEERYDQYTGLMGDINYKFYDKLTFNALLPYGNNLQLDVGYKKLNSAGFIKSYNAVLQNRLFNFVNNHLSFGFYEKPSGNAVEVTLNNSINSLSFKGVEAYIGLSNKFIGASTSDLSRTLSSINSVVKIDSARTLSLSLGLNANNDFSFDAAFNHKHKDFFYSIRLKSNNYDKVAYFEVGTNFFKRNNEIELLSTANPVLSHLMVSAELLKPDHSVVPLKNLRVRVNHKSLKVKEGKAMVENLPPDNIVFVSIKKESLPDPNWIVENKDYVVETARGSFNEIKFKVYETGEIDGFVKFIPSDGDDYKPLSGVEVSLYDSKLNKVKSTVTAYDGYYLFDGILPGIYYIKMNDCFLSRNAFSKEALKVNLSAENLFIYNADFDLKRHAALDELGGKECKDEEDGSGSSAGDILQGYSVREVVGE